MQSFPKQHLGGCTPLSCPRRLHCQVHVAAPATLRRRSQSFLVTHSRTSLVVFAKGRYDDKKKSNLCNREISVPEVRVLDEDKSMLGILPTDLALKTARDKGLDLVMVTATAEPPVCQITDYNKFIYAKVKEAKEAKKKQRASRTDLKELKMRPSTDIHDYNVRLRKAVQEIGKGNHVKIVVRFKGREFQFQDQGRQLIEKFISDLGDAVVVDKNVRMEGRQMTATVTPKKST